MNKPAILDQMSALADGLRGRMLLLLEDHELTVSELGTVLQLPQSTTSRQLKALSEAGWVTSRPDGTRRLYQMNNGTDDGLLAAHHVRLLRVALGDARQNAHVANRSRRLNGRCDDGFKRRRRINVGRVQPALRRARHAADDDRGVRGRAHFGERAGENGVVVSRRQRRHAGVARMSRERFAVGGQTPDAKAACAPVDGDDRGHAVSDAVRPSSSIIASRITNFWGLPVTVIGSSDLKRT